MSKRLKLYEDIIRTYLEHKDKEKFKKIAFANKMTVSELNRTIIKLVIKSYELRKLNSKLYFNNKNMYKIFEKLGGDF